MPSPDYFDNGVRRGRLAYWEGVRNEQLGLPHDRRHTQFAADYFLGVHHVSVGIIPRETIVRVHDGPELEAAPGRLYDV